MENNKYILKIIPCLKECGTELSMDIIAEKSRVSRKTLYNHFETKEKLMVACNEYLIREFCSMVGCLADETVPVQKGFVDGIMGLWHFFSDISHSFIADVSKYHPENSSNSHLLGSGHFEKLLQTNLERGIETGVYRTDIDPDLMSKYIAFSVFSFFHKRVMMGGICTAEHYFRTVIDFNLQALLNK